MGRDFPGHFSYGTRSSGLVALTMVDLQLFHWRRREEAKKREFAENYWSSKDGGKNMPITIDEIYDGMTKDGENGDLQDV